MKVGFWPFYSQQNKRTGHILQQTCGAAKQLAFLASQLQQRGHECVAAVPLRSLERSPFECELRHVHVPNSNPVQRAHWDTEALRHVFGDCDVAVCNNEYHAIPLRVVLPKLKIIQMCSVQPDDMKLFKAAWAAADLVVAQGKYAAEQMRELCWSVPVVSWPMAYDERQFAGRDRAVRDVDVCFVQRCSANDATHHVEYIEAMHVYGWRTVFTDVTGYLAQQPGNYEFSSPDTYIDTLFRSRVAVSMYRSWYGGLSIREAIRAGCVPVVLDEPGYMELVGDKWPFVVRSPVTSGAIAAAVETALSEQQPYLVDVSAESYQVASTIAVEDVCRLSR